MNKHLFKSIGQRSLTTEEAIQVMHYLLKPEVSTWNKARILSRLNKRNYTKEEFVGYLTILEDKMVRVTIDNPQAIDVCGTGGDGLNTFNISTVVAFVLAGCGVTVAKHGNRSASGPCGSADFMEEIGVDINMSPQKIEKCINTIGIGFMYAPEFQPHLREVRKARKSVGKPTIFNALGPVMNPALVPYQVIGVWNEVIFKLLGEVLSARPQLSACLVRSRNASADEVSLCDTSALLYPHLGGVTKNVRHEHFSLRPRAWTEVTVRSRKESVEMGIGVLTGLVGPARDIVMANTAVALELLGKVTTLTDGVQMAREAIDSRRAFNKLKELQKFK